MEAQQAFCDDPLDAEEQDIAQRHDKGRRDNGQQCNKSEQPFAGHIQAGDDIGEQECHRRAGDGGDQGHEQAVFDGGEPAGPVEQLQIGPPIGEQDDLDHWIDHKYSHKQDNGDDDQQQERFIFQPLHFFDGFPCGRARDHRDSSFQLRNCKLQKCLPALAGRHFPATG